MFRSMLTTKTTQPRPQVSSVDGALTCNCAFTFDVIGWLIAKFFQIWSREAGYGELLMHALLANKKRRNILNE